MNRIFFFAVAVFSFCSCNSFEGKIESRKTPLSCITYFTHVAKDTTLVVTRDTVVYDAEQIKRTRVQDSINSEKEKDLQAMRGDIEKNAEEIFLINSSRSQSIAFTIKKSYYESKSTSTSIITLEPGEETVLGCNTEISSEKIMRKVKYDVVGEKLIK